MGLGKYKPTLEQLANNYVFISETKREKNQTYNTAVDYIKTVVCGNMEARRELEKYFHEKITEYKKN